MGHTRGWGGQSNLHLLITDNQKEDVSTNKADSLYNMQQNFLHVTFSYKSFLLYVALKISKR